MLYATEVFNHYINAFKYIMDAFMTKMYFVPTMPIGYVLVTIGVFGIVIRYLIGRFN